MLLYVKSSRAVGLRFRGENGTTVSANPPVLRTMGIVPYRRL